MRLPVSPSDLREMPRLHPQREAASRVIATSFLTTAANTARSTMGTGSSAGRRNAPVIPPELDFPACGERYPPPWRGRRTLPPLLHAAEARLAGSGGPLKSLGWLTGGALALACAHEGQGRREHRWAGHSLHPRPTRRHPFDSHSSR